MKMKGKKLLWLLSVLVVPITYSGIALSGNLEPSGTPGSTMRTLEELQPSWSKKITDASKRFELVLDGEAVLDKETGLVWEKSPDTTTRTWIEAIDYAYDKTVGGRDGWRLPTVEELKSLVDKSVSGSPKLPSGHPFTIVQSGGFWSSATYPGITNSAWYVGIGSGSLGYYVKSNPFYVWCVRGGHGHDGQ